MKSPVVKRSIVIAGHKTSVSLEDAFWKGLKEIASGRDATLSELVASIDADRQHGNLSSALRLFVLDFYRNQLSEEISLQSTPHDEMMVARILCPANPVVRSGRGVSYHARALRQEPFRATLPVSLQPTCPLMQDCGR